MIDFVVYTGYIVHTLLSVFYFISFSFLPTFLPSFFNYKEFVDTNTLYYLSKMTIKCIVWESSLSFSFYIYTKGLHLVINTWEGVSTVSFIILPPHSLPWECVCVSVDSIYVSYSSSSLSSSSASAWRFNTLWERRVSFNENRTPEKEVSFPCATACIEEPPT